MLSRQEILAWLREEDPQKLAELWRMADTVRHCCVGDQVHLRGLVEISSYCCRQCAYCGLRADNRELARYRMTEEEILACADEAVRLGYGTLVMQAGEDDGIRADWLASLVRRIKASTKLAVTLSLGERDPDELELWKAAGADRYLLRFETSHRALYERIHPPRTQATISDRIALLRQLREIGYEIGSGVMTGIPGQTYESLADDLEAFAALDLDMIGIGPFIAHPNTPIGRGELPMAKAGEQVPGGEEMVYKMVALTRLLCPQANIPATTALATVNKVNGRENGLQRGANVVMPNLTPLRYRALYQIYPAKACIDETAAQCNGCLRRRVRSIGRSVGVGPGGRKREVYAGR
jgi:biotin synthase